ncbi:MAG: ATP-binding protein, partial [Phycisphaerales bacterium]
REVENAKSGHSVEEAQQEVDRAAEALTRDLQEAEQKVAGQAVVEWLREEASEKTQPAVLRNASDLFQRITHGRYELHVDDAADGPTFVAWDTQHEVQKSLDQLSAGERVQLLVAVRLGFLEQEKSGVRLPLILDETLGTTDDERASAIIDTVVEICRSGRQVFYLTAQPDEVGKWAGRLQGVDDVDLKQVNLGRVRGLAEADNAPLVIERPAEVQLPDPAGVSREDYGKALAVPGLDPNRPLGMVHLWHLIDDPRVLHALLVRRIRCWGPFESLVVKGGLSVDSLDEDALSLLGARARVVRAVFTACRVGRGKPVDRAALAASGAVTDAFIDRIAELAASLGGDASQLIDAIESGQVQRWRSNNTDLLRDYLEQEGYLDPEQPLMRDEVYHRALEAAAKERPERHLGEGWLDRVVDGLTLDREGLETGSAE